MKKFLALLLALVMVLSFVGCKGKANEGDEKKETGNGKVETEGEVTNDGEDGDSSMEFDDNSLYLITDQGTIDDKSFNQSSFEGLKQFADEVGVKANYIRPMGEGDQMLLQAIDQAVEAGAKVIVAPGFLFVNTISKAQEKYPEIKFICVDYEPEDGDTKEVVVGPNTVSILYKENQPGFLAGYAAVMEGFTNLGYMGGVGVPPVIRYGFGFVQGAAYAGEKLGKDINVKFHYTGTFNESPDIKTKAASWYREGTEIIFVAGGGIYRSIISAAQDQNKLIIGVDSDQKDEGKEVLTSAMKNVKGTVYDAVKSIKEGNFEGGKTLNLGVEENAIQISDDFSRFKNFKEEDYKEIFNKLLNNEEGLLDNMVNINFELPQNEQADPRFLEDDFDNLSVEYLN